MTEPICGAARTLSPGNHAVCERQPCTCIAGVVSDG